MAIFTRTTKSNGTTDVKDGETITAAEVNAEVNALVNEYNGNIDNRNIATTAGQLIGSEKLESHATTDANYRASTSGGTTFALSKPTSMDGEIEAIRYRLKQISGGGDMFKGTDTAGTLTDLSWLEPNVVGPNLFTNAGFEVQSSGAGTAPDGWTLTGSPSTIAIEAASELDEGKNKRSLNIIAATAGNEGVNVAMAGLKADTKYVVGAAYARTTGTFSVSTSGAVSSGAYRDISSTDNSSTTLQTANYVFQTDSSGSTVTCSFLVTGIIGAEVNLYRVWLKEMNDRTSYEGVPHIPTQTASFTTNTAVVGTTGGAFTDTTLSDLSLSAYVPSPGYELIYETTLSLYWSHDFSTVDDTARVKVEMDIDGGGYNTVDTWLSASGRISGSTTDSWPANSRITLRHLVPVPVPGSTYSFRVIMSAYNTRTVAVNVSYSGNTTDVQSNAELSMRRV